MPDNFQDPYNLKPVNIQPTNTDLPNVISPFNASQERIENANLSFSERVVAATQPNKDEFAMVATSELSPRYPKYFPGVDNEDLYAQGQTAMDKATNGVVKMAGIAGATFVNGTAGLIYGIGSAIKNNQLSKLFDNDVTQSANAFTARLEDTSPHYKTAREQNGSWWEPSNLFTGNFFWDGVVKNLGFSIGAYASGFAIGGALEATGLTAKLAGMGKEWASAGLKAIEESALLPQVEQLPSTLSKLRTLYTEAKAAAGKGLTHSNQFITALGGSFGEGSMEAYNNMHEFRDNMVKEFQNKYGYSPDGQDLENINKYAENVGKWSLGLNVALLTGTNYIQLPKIFSSSFKGEKSEINNLAFNVEKEAWKSTLPEKGIGKLLYQAKSAGSLFFNTAEAFEEGAQYAIQTGTQQFFGRQYQQHAGEQSFTDNLLGLFTNEDGLSYGVKQALTTDEGLENIFLGGFSGALQSAGIVGSYKNAEGKTRIGIGKTGKIGERGVFGYGGEDAKNREEAIAAWNNSSFKEKLKSFVNSSNRSAVTQQMRANSIKIGDVLESKDLEFDYAHDYITSRLKYGGLKAVSAEINDVKNRAATDTGFLSLQQEGIAAQTDTQESFLKRLFNIEAQAKNTNSLYEQANIKYKGIVNKETGERVYSDDVIDKMVYAAAKVADYDQRVPQLTSELLTKGIDVQGILEDILINGTPSVEATKDVLNQINNLNTISETKDSLKTSLQDVIELSLRRKEFLKEYDEIKTSPSEWKQPTKESLKENVIIKQRNETGKLVPMEIEVGKTYPVFSNDAVFRDGNKLIYQPSLTILSKTLGGEYEVKTPDGTITFMKPSEIKDYSLSFTSHSTSKSLEIAIEKAVDGILNKEANKEFLQLLPDTPSLQDKLDLINTLNNKVLVDAVQKAIREQTKQLQEDLKKQREQEEALKRNQKVVQEIFKSQDVKKANNTSGEKIKFEPEHKKAANILFAATRAFSLLFAKKKNKDAVAPPHTLRSNYFGGMFNTFLNKENMRMMLVHEGMPGYEEIFKLLTDYASTSDDNKAILSIAVIEEKDGWKYVNQYGKSIGKVGEEFSPNDIVFQVMPSATDKWTDGSKATRSTDEEALTLHNLEVYRKQRADILSQTSPSAFYEFSPSFGLPVVGEDGKAIFVENTPQPVSNIAPASELSIVISTNADEIVRSHNGTVAVKVPLGRPMAVTNNTVQHLNNRKLTEKEQNTIYKILQSIAKFALEDNIAENETANKLFDYLRGVVYWGIPKNDAGRNSIWFDSTPNGEYFLHIGNNKYTVPLSPIYLSSPEGEATIRAALSEMYNNTNIDILKKTDAFYEIEDVDEEGNITKEKRWDNYTSYLTSVEGRSPNELPLSTNIPTFINDDVQTREGIYFVLHAAQDAYLSALPKKQEVAKVEQKIESTGEQKNLDTSTNKEDVVDIIAVLSARTNKEAMISKYAKSFKRDGGSITVNELRKFAETGELPPFYIDYLNSKTEHTAVEQEILDTYKEKAPAVQTEQVDTPSSTESKKADIERRRQEANNKNEEFWEQFTAINAEEVADRDNLINKLIKDIPLPANTRINNWVLEELNGKLWKGKNIRGKEEEFFGKENWDKIKEAKKQFDIEFKKIEDSNLAKIKLIEQKQSALLSTVDGVELRRAWSLGLIEEPNIVGLDETNFISKETELKRNGDLVETDNYEGYYYLSKPDEDGEWYEQIIGKTEKEVENKINAKYDAEYVDAVKKGEMTKEQAMQALEEIGRKDSSAYLEIDNTGKEGVKELFEQNPELANAVYEALGFKTESSSNTITRDIKEELPFKVMGNYNEIDEGLIGRKFYEEKIGNDLYRFEISNYSYPNEDGSSESFYDIDFTVNGSEEVIGTGFFDKAERAKQILQALLSQNFGNDTVRFNVEESKKGKQRLSLYKRLMNQLGYNPSGEMEYALFYDIKTDKVNLTPQQKQQAQQLYAQYLSQNPNGSVEGFKAWKAEYDAELAGLTTPSSTLVGRDVNDEEIPAENPPANDLISVADLLKKIPKIPSKRETRLVTSKNVKTEDWNKVEKWLEKNFKGVPVYRVKNLMAVGQNTYAWGLFADGAIYLYEDAELGTAYHEVFHAVSEHFSSPEEKTELLKEFNKRKGTFVTRDGNTISYSNAVWKQAEEQLAEEFRNYVLRNSSIAGKIGQFFKDLLSFVKNLFFGKSKIDQLFKDINAGNYREYVSSLNQLSFAKQGIMDVDYVSTDGFRNFETSKANVNNLTAIEEKDVLEHLTSRAFDYLFYEVKDLFKIGKYKSKEFYDFLKQETLGFAQNADGSPVVNDEGNIVTHGDGGIIAGPLSRLQDALEKGIITEDEYAKAFLSVNNLYNKLLSNWENIKERHKIYMSTFNIKFDENDELVNTDENKTGRETGQDAMQVDHIRKANAAIKLLFASIKDTTFDTPTKDDVLSNTETAQSSIGGDKLASFGKSFIQTLNHLADSPTFDVMMDNLINQAKVLPNYVRLFSRLKGNRVSGKIQWENMTIPELQLLMTFFRTFSKQAPEVLNHTISDDGTAYISSGNIANAASQLAETYEQSVIRTVKNSKMFSSAKEGSVKGWKVNKDALKGIEIRTDENAQKFLQSLGIDVEMRGIPSDDKKIIKAAASGILTALTKSATEGSLIATISNKIIDIAGRIHDIAETQVKLTLEGNDSVFFNINGELQQTYVEKNYPSHLSDVLNNVKNTEQLNSTNFSYLINDVFSKGSQLMKQWFNADGERTGDKIRIGYINGTIDETKNRRTATDRLSKGARLLQQVNLALSGWYYTLVPSDSSTEWMMNMKNIIQYGDVRRGNNDVLNDVFKGYLASEVGLAKENRQGIVALKGRANKLRMFDDILPDNIKEELIKGKDFEATYTKFQKEIEASVNTFITDLADELKRNLKEYKLVDTNTKGSLLFPSIDITNISEFRKDGFTEDTLDYLTKYIASNYAIANIEMFKTIFGDPYEYTDLIKRIKSFVSPSETSVHSSPEINKTLTKEYNAFLAPGDPGYRAFSESVRTIALADVNVISEHYKNGYTEPNAQGLITDEADREFKLKSSLWNEQYEEQYQYDKAWERMQKAGKLEAFPNENTPKYTYTTELLFLHDEELLQKGNPNYKSLYVTKPIVRGNKFDSTDNHPIVDKLSLAAISYRAMMEFNKDSNMVKLYNKLINEKIDYAIFESGRKVGNAFSNSAYDNKGIISSVPFKGIVNVGFENFSIQVQTQPKEENKQTLGSQLTKLATLDMMAAGVPIDYMPKEKNKDKRFAAWNKETDKEKASPLYKEIKNNQRLLEELMNNGYDTLKRKLGIEEENGTFKIKNKEQAAKILKEEILRQDVNDNILKALDYFSQDKIALEATPMYQQFKNILYAIVDKNITSPKVNGGPKVQMASTFFENQRGITKKKDKNGNPFYTADNLKWYVDEDGQRHIEVYLSSSYIRKQLGKHKFASLSDEELLTKLSPEVLKGIGFRIPSQNSNSFDVFVVKKFLPVEMGDTIVVPSELVNKTGSDFDIDKLNTYLKNIHIVDGKIVPIPYFGIGEQARIKIKEYLLRKGIEKIEGKAEETLDELDYEDSVEKDADEESKIYRQSLQNAYYDSLEQLISHPLNFQKLVSPNDAGLLKNIAKDISDLRQLDSEETSPSKLLDLGFMLTMRHNFLTGKNGVGIGAVSQTNHANNQRSAIYVNPASLENMDEEMKEWLGDGKILLPHNQRQVDGQTVASLSEIDAQDGNKISDVVSMFIDGAVDISKGAWVVNFLGNIKSLSTALFLTKIGVPAETVGMFINQPIILDYLKKLDEKGYSWMFIDTFVKELNGNKEAYKTESPIPSILHKGNITELNNYLRSSVGKSAQELSSVEKAYQQAVLSEFLKYTKMAQHLFIVTQGTNFDTANINDPYVLFKKLKQLERAQTTIISSADKLLESSFIGNIKTLLSSARNAIGQLLPTENENVRFVLESVLSRYIDVPDRQFIKISRQVVQGFLDFLVQTHKYGSNVSLNSRIKAMMVDDGNVPSQVRQLINSLPKNSDLRSNPVIDGILTLEGKKDGATANLKLKNKNSESYEQNSIIKGFQELRSNPLFADKIEGGRKYPGLYSKILRVSLLQGLANSPISFTQFLPVEDVVEALQPVIDQLSSIPNLQDFADLYMFERNNWNNTDVVPQQYEWKKNTDRAGKETLKIYDRLKEKTEKFLGPDGVPLVVEVNTLSRNTDSDIITISYKKTNDEKGKPYTEQRIARMKKNGDYSYIYKGLFQKIRTADGKPLISAQKPFTIQDTGEVVKPLNYVYKLINAWGDRFNLQEYYTQARPSVVNNGYESIEKELDNNDIIKQYLPTFAQKNMQQELPFNNTQGRTVAVIGTAGRSQVPTLTEWNNMLKDAASKVNPNDTLISGGAAFADHIAVKLFLEGKVKGLKLRLPARIKDGKFVGGYGTAGGTANYYHAKFDKITGKNSIAEIEQAIKKGAETTYETETSNKAMFLRNAKVAGESNAMIAYTYGEGNIPADGGTKDTWDSAKYSDKTHVSINSINNSFDDFKNTLPRKNC